MNSSTKGNEMAVNISDGRRFEVRTVSAHEHAIVMVQANGDERIRCYVTGTVEMAHSEAIRIAKGINFDLAH